MNKKTVLIPYWLQEDPCDLDSSDNSWWFAPLQKYDNLIFAGPYLKNTSKEDKEGTNIYQIQTKSLIFNLKEIENELFTSNTGIEIKDISVVWNVIEMSATCRVLDLDQFDGTKIALIGDTHHLKRPISSLIPYINESDFNYIFCTQSHHAFFFEMLCTRAKVHSFPYSLPPYFNPNNIIEQISNEKNLIAKEPLYRGNIMSSFHQRRTELINFLLTRTDIILKERLHWNKWVRSLESENHRLIISTINGNFSPQLMYPLLYGKSCFADKMSTLNWLGEIIDSAELCYLHANKYECLQNIRLAKARNKPHDILHERMMQMKASISIYSSLNRLNVVQEAFKDIANNIGLLNELRTHREIKLKHEIDHEVLKRPTFKREVLSYFEITQELYNRGTQQDEETLTWLKGIPKNINQGLRELLPHYLND